MKAYDIDIENLRESQEITDEKELLKLKLTSEFLKVTSKMKTEDILFSTGLHKSDLSRLRSLNVSRFTIDRIVSYLDDLGFTTAIKVKSKKTVAS
jgi:predicted XRE-type DNA-binding protein